MLPIVQMFLWLALICIAVGIFIAFVMLQGYLQPLHQRLANRDVEKKAKSKYDPGYKWCCPPGIACNDSEYTRSPCRRKIAYGVADMAETRELDEVWIALNRDPCATTLDAWETRRDELIARKVDNKSVLGLTTTTSTVAQIARGKVLDP